MHKTIAITGAGGFIGKALVQALHQQGYVVKALVHTMPAQQITGVSYHQYEMNEVPGSIIFKDVNVVIHLAFQFHPVKNQEQDTNIFAATELLRLGIQQYI